MVATILEFRDYVQKVQPGSHHHLFLPSDFPKRNWFKLKPLASLDGVSENCSVPCMEGKNSRIHNKGSQSINKVVQLVNDEVCYKLLSLKFKPIKNSVEAAGRWQLGEASSSTCGIFNSSALGYLLLELGVLMEHNIMVHDSGCQWKNDLHSEDSWRKCSQVFRDLRPEECLE
ncbi:hypothetical protein Tco_1429408 [Tanacetum coccineum]